MHCTRRHASYMFLLRCWHATGQCGVLCRWTCETDWAQHGVPFQPDSLGGTRGWPLITTTSCEPAPDAAEEEAQQEAQSENQPGEDAKQEAEAQLEAQPENQPRKDAKQEAAAQSEVQSGNQPGEDAKQEAEAQPEVCLLYTSPSPRDKRQSRMPSSA